MWKYILAMSWGTMIIGWGVMGNAVTSPILIVQFGWDVGQTKFYNSLLSVMGLIGVMVGSLLGGVIITYGRR